MLLGCVGKAARDSNAADIFSGIGKDHRVGCINGKQQDKQKTEHSAKTDCHMMVELVEYWLEKADEQNAAESEADSAHKADIAVQVQQASGVIPPADVPFPF